MVLPRDPKIAQNREKLCSRGLPESTLQKVTKNYAIWKGQTSEFADAYTLSAVFSSGPRPPKRSPKASQNGAFGHPKSQKNRKTNTQKNTKKLMQKVSKTDLKKEGFFVAERSPKSQKSEPWVQNGAPGLQERFPGIQNTQKSAKNEILGFQTYSRIMKNMMIRA